MTTGTRILQTMLRLMRTMTVAVEEKEALSVLLAFQLLLLFLLLLLLPQIKYTDYY